MTARILRRVRKNPDFIESVRLLDELGLDFVLEAPRGKGHPMMRIGAVRWPISTTPRAGMRVANVRTNLRKRLRAAGMIS